MKASYEIKVYLNDDVLIYNRELTVENTHKDIIKAALIAAISKSKDTCLQAVGDAIDQYQET